jgi:hypothetical protein
VSGQEITMMEAVNALSSARVSTPAELTSPQNRVETPKPAGAPERQAEAPPSVTVQISSAAREVAAREGASAAQDNNTTPTPPPPPRPPASADAGSDTATDTSSSNAASAQSAQVRQALQLFSDNAGSGVAQTKPSPLRASA